MLRSEIRTRYYCVKKLFRLLKERSYKLNHKVITRYGDPAKKFPQLKDFTFLEGVFSLTSSPSWNFNNSTL